MTINPVVAPIATRPGDPWAGVWLAEDIEAIRHGIATGSWIDSSLGGVGAGLDALAALSDPAGALLQYGLSWLMEHVKPLSAALDWLAGDPAQIAAHAQSWRTVAIALNADSGTLQRAAAAGTTGWSGAAATAYRTWSSREQTILDGLSNAATTMASVTEGVAYLTAGVRTLIRDAIATVVSRAISYAGEEALSFGLATPWVVEQVSTLVAAWSARIARWIDALRSSVARLVPLIRRLGELIDRLTALLRDSGGAASDRTAAGKAAAVPPARPIPGSAPMPIAPDTIRFSQGSVTGAAEITASMRADGWVGPPIDVVQMPDGALTAVDNTRVLAAKQAGIDVSANVHGFDEPLPPDMVARFATRAAQPKTWGDAITLRISRQKAALRVPYPNGSWLDPASR